MKLSQPVMKLIIKLIILMMLLVLMFIISSFLYSVRYWPDVYNYINANITIKRIPTLSELELTVVEVIDYTTEGFSTTDIDYIDISTIDDFDIDEFMKDEINFKYKVKRNIVVEQLKDYIELPPKGIFVDYVFLEEPIKHETSTAKIMGQDEIDPKDNAKDTGIFKTSVTGVVLEDELSRTTKSEVSEEPVVTKQYYTVQPLKIAIVEKLNDLKINDVTTDYLPEHITTKEGYLVGDDPHPDNMDGELTKKPFEITTKNENELVDEEQGTRLIEDSVDVSKLSTRGSEDVEMITRRSRRPEKLVEVGGQQKMPDPICHGDESCNDFAKTIFPWVVTIFVTNDTKQRQFVYNCDGALLSDKIIITGARCMYAVNRTWEPENVLVFLGKGNLQAFGGNEKVQKVKEIMLHPNLTMDDAGKVVNDLALLVLEEPVEYSDNIRSACIHQGDSVEEAATTAWGLDGALIPIFFEKNQSENCYNKDQDIFCVTYGNNVPLCPSYGGVYASKIAGRWCLQGMFYGDPADRGVCFAKDVFYTSLKNYLDWITETFEMYKNYIL